MTEKVIEYFSGLASLYAKYRPSYAGGAIRMILDGLPKPIQVADVGCGTGISSRQLAELSATVVGVDPNLEMLEEACCHDKPSTGSITYQQGTGENTQLRDGSVDVVVCAQSFHWFNNAESLKEFHRILRPRGRLALMWNAKDGKDPFSARIADNAARAQADAIDRGLTVHPDRSANPIQNNLFTNSKLVSFSSEQRLDLDGLLGRAQSASYFPKSGPIRDELEDELRQLFKQFQSEGFVELRYQTELTLADRVDL